MFDKCIDKHKNPWTMLFHLFAFIAGIYGLWNHDWTWIIIAVVIAIIGHLFPSKKKRR